MLIWQRARQVSNKLSSPRLIIFLIAILILIIALLGLSLAWDFSSGKVREFNKQRMVKARGFTMGLSFDSSNPQNEKIAATMNKIGQLADIVLIQEPIAWQEYLDWKGQDTTQIRRLKEKISLARRQGLKVCLVLDPLNATDHDSPNFPKQVKDKSFANPQIMQIFKLLAVKMAREIKPDYLGLASEINAYDNLNHNDFDNFELLYKETYQEVKDVRPKTKVFVTWQYEDLEGLWWWDKLRKGVKTTKLVDRFSDYMDIFAISTFPSLVFESPMDMPKDFYLRASKISKKPLAIVESGWSSEGNTNGYFVGNETDQALYVALMPTYFDNENLEFWIYRLAYDLDLDEYKPIFAESQLDPEVMSIFSSMGLKDVDGRSKKAFRNWYNTYHNKEGRNF